MVKFSSIGTFSSFAFVRLLVIMPFESAPVANVFVAAAAASMLAQKLQGELNDRPASQADKHLHLFLRSQKQQNASSSSSSSSLFLFPSFACSSEFNLKSPPVMMMMMIVNFGHDFSSWPTGHLELGRRLKSIIGFSARL